MKPSMRILGLTCVLAMVPGLASAAACTSNATGTWGTVGTWDCGHVPTAADSVTIASGHTVTISANSNAGSLDVAGTLNVGNGLTVAGTTTVSGTLIHSTTTGAKTHTGDVIVTGTWQETAAEGISFGGNLQNSGTLTASTGTHTFSGAGKAFSGTLLIPNVTINGSYTNNGTLTVSGGLTGGGSLTNSGGATLNLGGPTTTITTLTATAGGNIVNYMRTGSTQTLKNTVYDTLNLSGSAPKSITGGTVTVSGNLSAGGTGTTTVLAAGSLSVTGNLTIPAGSMLSASGGVSVGGATSVLGTFRSSGTGTKSFTGDVTIGGAWSETSTGGISFAGNLQNNGTFTGNATAVHTFTGSGKTIAGPVAIPRVTINGSYTNVNTLTVSTALAGAGSLTNPAGATLNIGATAVNLTIGTLDATANGNVVNYNAGTQTIKGTTYYHLNLSGTSTKTISTATTVLGNMSTSGATTGSLTGGILSISGNLTIGSGSTLTVGAADISVTGTTSISGTLNHSGMTGTKTFTGDVTINASGRWRENLTAAGTAISFAGNVQNGGTFTGYGTTTANAVKHIFTGAGKTLGGTLTMPSVTMDGGYTNNGTLTVSMVLAGGGSLTNGTNATLSVGATNANFTLTTLDIAASGNTVVYSGAAQTIRPMTYVNLGTSGSSTKTAGGNLTVTGNVSIGNGTRLAGGSYTHTIFGNMVNTGSGTLTTNTSTYVFTGSAAQALGGGNNTITLNFYKLTIDKSGSSSLSLASNVSVSNLLTLNAGTVVTNTFSLASARNCALSGTLTRGSGYVVGNLSRAFPTTNNVTCSFPIGDSVGYAPVTIVKSGNTSGTLFARVDNGDHPDGSVEVGIDQSKNANHYWTLTRGTISNATNYKATFQFCASTGTCAIPAEVDSGATIANFVAARTATGTSAWGILIPSAAPSNNSILLSGLTGFGYVFDVGEKAAYHHIGLVIPRGSCTGTAAVTVTACQDSDTTTCQTLYTGSSVQVQVSTTGNASWGSGSTRTVTLTGSTTLDLTDSTSETVTVSGESVSPTPSYSTAYCYDSGGNAVACTVAFGNCSFDAVEKEAAAGTPIFTKLANAAFELDVIATGSGDITADKIDIVNGSTSCTAGAIGTANVNGAITFGPDERKTLSFTAGAASNAKARVTYKKPDGDATCAWSSDNFAIRPARFDLQGANGTFKAGVAPATLTALAVDSNGVRMGGYDGTPTLDKGKFSDQTGSLGKITAEDGTEDLVFGQASNGEASASLIYWETGQIDVAANAVVDNNFTAVDSGKATPECDVGSDSKDFNAGKLGCTIGSPGTATLQLFIPAYFVTTASAPCGTFAYSGQPFTVIVKACAGSEAAYDRKYHPADCGEAKVTKNYAKAVTISGKTVSGDDDKLGGFENNSGGASEGVATLSSPQVIYKFGKPPVSPTILKIHATDADGASSISGGKADDGTEGTMEFRSGRLKLDNAFGSESLSLPMKVTAQYYAGSDNGWMTNTGDSCSALRTSAAPVFASDGTAAPAPCRVYGGAPLSCALPPKIEETDTDKQTGILVNNPVTPSKARQRMTVGLSRPTLSINTMDTGTATLVMTAPGVAGRLGVTLLVPDFLKYNDNFPSATATFGIYKGVKSVIHFREQY